MSKQFKNIDATEPIPPSTFYDLRTDVIQPARYLVTSYYLNTKRRIPRFSVKYVVITVISNSFARAVWRDWCNTVANYRLLKSYGNPHTPGNPM
ncbi:hypothetical protein J6590_104237 [Homalodisca vitripennis]|nr:hypothetical protein J6590_018516 [Homalodisca vitripennis]KAG8304022.1 hypothetical protein J6590_104237 [Homalodisca vitripennis]